MSFVLPLVSPRACFFRCACSSGWSPCRVAECSNYLGVKYSLVVIYLSSMLPLISPRAYFFRCACLSGWAPCRAAKCSS
eukprot:184510-Pelagomonas_calceolata.AAC.1